MQEEALVRENLIKQTDALRLNEPVEEVSAVLQPLDSGSYADFMTRYYRGIAKAFNMPIKDAMIKIVLSVLYLFRYRGN